VCWEYGDVVGEAQDLVAERGIRIVREPLFELGAEEIYARDMPDEESATAEQVLRVVGAAHVADEERDVLGCVAGRGDTPHAERADVKTGAVGQREVWVVDACLRTGNNGDRPQLGERARPR